MNVAVLGYPLSFPAMTGPRVGADWRFGAAVLASVLIHGFALGWLPGLKGRMDAPEPEPRQTLQVRLAATAPKPPMFDVPPAPQPLTPAVSPAPTFARVTPPPVRRAPAPRPPVLARPVPQAEPAVAVPREVEPIPVTATPIETPRPSPPPAPPRPPAIDAGALGAYGRELAGAVATHQRYPRIALLRQWQGTAVLQLELAADGRLLAVRVLSSSGHDTLDRQALEMVRAAAPLPSLPAALAGRPLTVEVPVVFRITS